MKKNLKIGLKLWSINHEYLDEALELYKEGVYQYIELYVVPGSLNTYRNLWKQPKQLGVPFIIHAPHTRGGLNLARQDQEEENFKLIKETYEFTELVDPSFIIFHAGTNGSEEETARQLVRNYRNNIVIENKPYHALDGGLICNGYKPSLIDKIMRLARVGFCFDFGHAICAANSLEQEYFYFLQSFNELGPSLYHLTDGDAHGKYDQHLHFGEGDYEIEKILSLVPEGAMITLETKKNSKDNLDDFVKDVSFIRDVCR